MKPRKPLPRGHPPKRKSWLKRGTKPIPTVNKGAAKRRHARYKAFMASEAWKRIRAAALVLAGHRCEQIVTPDAGERPYRCFVLVGLTIHHKTYRRFGGKERPSDLAVLCGPHHAAEEAKKTTTPLWMRAQ